MTTQHATSRDSTFGGRIAAGAHVIGPTRHGVAKGGYSRSYLFEDGDELTLVDTGWDDDAYMILKYLASIGRSPEELTNIVLTHAHRSHLGGLATLAALSGATVSCHEAEKPIVQGTKKADPIRLWPPVPLSLIPFRVISYLPILNHTPWPVSDTLGHRSTVGPLTVLHTPGHTDGHLAFSFRDSVIAVGDAVATWPDLGPGWPGFNHDEQQYRRSLVELVALEPQVVGPGHGEPIVENTPQVLAGLVRGRRFRKLRAKAAMA